MELPPHVFLFGYVRMWQSLEISIYITRKSNFKKVESNYQQHYMNPRLNFFLDCSFCCDQAIYLDLMNNKALYFVTELKQEVENSRKFNYPILESIPFCNLSRHSIGLPRIIFSNSQNIAWKFECVAFFADNPFLFCVNAVFRDRINQICTKLR